jgi:serine/threonine-protein kinase Chk2
VALSVDKGGLVWGRLVSLGSQYASLDCDKDCIVIGRGKKSDIRFADELGISTRHCTISRTVDDGKGTHAVFVQDESTNGTFVDGARLQRERTLLKDGSELSFYKSETEKITFLFQDLYSARDTASAVKKTRYERGTPERKYDVKKELGSGAFATVKLVINKATGQPFAMKVLDKKKVAMSSHSKRDTMQDEIELLSQIDHPHIVFMEEVFETDKELFLVLELVTGGELFDRIVTSGRLTERQARPLFRQMVSAVKYLHNKGIAHRDLKPENILLCRKRATSNLSADALARAKTLVPAELAAADADATGDDEEWQVKLADFGLSRMVSEGSFMQTLAGTPQYVAPEVLSGVAPRDPNDDSNDDGDDAPKGYGKECDIWSLGVILFVMLSGTAPFDDEQQPKLFANICSGLFSFDAPCWGSISDSAKDLIRRMLCVDVKKRLSLDGVEKSDWLNPSAAKPNARKAAAAVATTAAAATTSKKARK